MCSLQRVPAPRHRSLENKNVRLAGGGRGAEDSCSHQVWVEDVDGCLPPKKSNGSESVT